MAQPAFLQKLKLGISVLLIISGIAMYWGWGLMYGSWNFFDPVFVPVYGITIVLLLFGVLGILLVRYQNRQAQ
jgi:hypothetical protein